MTLTEAKNELDKFVKLKTTQRPVFADVLTGEDVVQVVRCRDCEYAYDRTSFDIMCRLWESDGFKPGDYCSLGERAEV